MDFSALKLNPPGDKETAGLCKDFGKNGEIVMAADMY